MASPRAKKLAEDLGVDLATVKGTGPAGKITEQDVQNAAAAKPAAKPAPRPSRPAPPLPRQLPCPRRRSGAR